MTKEAIRLCIKRKELDTPELDRLYLHHKGFSEMRNLEKYTQLAELFLEGNDLTMIEKGKLNAQKKLKSLHLQKNKIGEISVCHTKAWLR